MRKSLVATFCLNIVGLLSILPVVPEAGQAQSAADPSVAGAVYEHSPVSVVDDAYEQPGNAAGEGAAGEVFAIPSGLPPAESAPETVASGCYETLPETVASVVYEVYANVLVIAGDTPVKIVRAMNEITKEYPNVKFVARSNEQALADPELENLIQAADLIYLDLASSQLTERLKNLASLLAGKKVIVFNSPPQLTRLSSIGSFDFEGAEKAIAEINEARELPAVNELVYTYPQLAPYLEAKKYALSDTGGLENYRNMFLYLLNQTVPTVVYAAYQMVPEQFIYYRGSIYPDLESYLPLLDPGRPAVGILAWAPQTYQADDLVLLDGLIASLEERGLNVICLLTRQKEVTGIRQVFWNAEAIINLLPFDLPLPAELLRDLNIPVFRPVVLNQEPADQEEISLSLPLQADAQGQIEPLLLAVAKTKRDESTGLVYRQLAPANGRLDCLGERVFNWLRLRKLANSEKRVALVFYNSPPGKQNIGARYLAVPDSILSILDTLKENGYRVENVPATPAELLKQIYEKGINVGSWTPGKLKELAGKAILIPGEEYRKWFQKLPPVLQKEVVEGPFGYLEGITRLALAEHEQDEAAREIARWKDQLRNVLDGQEKAAELVEMAAQTATRMVYLGAHGTVDEEVYGLGEQLAALKKEFLALRLPGLTGWGEPPGTQMTVKKEGKDYLVIPGVYFGNVFVAPQPLPGFDDPGMLYHNPVIPPPHQYLAFYAWLNKNFHAVVHLGCRGSYEWLPGKESALRPFHYPETVIGALPSIYLYLADDGGESTLAKRRGLAVVVDHLVPPLERVHLSGEPARPEQAIIPNGLHVYGREWSKERIAFHGLTIFPSLTELLARARGLNDHQLAPDLREEVDRLAQNLALGLLSGKTPLQLVADLAVDQAVYPGLDDALAAELSRVLNQLDGHFKVVRESFAAEKEQLLRALSGSSILPGTGGDPMKNPASLPTGRNLYHLPRAFLPTREAWQAGAELAEQLLAGHPPEKVAVFLGDGDEGVSLAFGLRLLGVSPVWDENSVVSRVYPLEAPLKQTVDVLFIAAPGLDQIPALLDEALKIALAQSYHAIASLHPNQLVSLDSALATVSQGVYGSKPLAQNIFARNWVEMTRQLLARGISPEEAGRLALIRVFGLPWGVYENCLPAAVQRTGTWDTPARLADLYLQNTSSAYGENVAGYARPGLFKEHLKGVEQIYFSQTSHLFGVLDTDKGFANAGGLALAVQRVKGEAAPVSVFNCDYQMESLNQYLEKELQARYFNPLWIKGMMAFDFSGARTIADFVFNFFGWQVVGQDVIQNWMWDELKAVYLDDKYNIGVSHWLQNGNNAYALIGILGTMMVAAQKGFWRVDEDTLKQLAELWAKLIIQMEPALCPVCEDFDLLMWALGYIDPALLDQLLKIIGEVVDKEIEVPGKEEPRPPAPAASTGGSGTRQKEPAAPKPLALPPEPEYLRRVPEPFEFIPPELEWRLAWETPDISPFALESPFVPEETRARAQSPRPDLAQSSPAPPALAPRTQETASRMQTRAAVPQEGPGGAKKVKAYELEEVRARVKGYLPLFGLAGVAVMFLLGVAGFFIQRAKRM